MTMQDMDFEEPGDPFGEWTDDLEPKHKRFILARVQVDSNNEAAEMIGVSPRAVKHWFAEKPQFRRACEALVTGMRTGSLELMKTRVMLAASKALEVWEDFLQAPKEDLTKNELERARLAKDFIVEVYKKAPQNRMPTVRDLEDKWDINALTQEVMGG